MDWGQDTITESSSNISVVNEQVLGVLREVWSFKDTDGRGTVGLEGSWCGLRKSEPCQVSAVELDLLGCDGESIVLCVSGIQCYLGALDVADHVEWSVVFADAERDRELAAGGYGVDSEGSVTGCD